MKLISLYGRTRLDGARCRLNLLRWMDELMDERKMHVIAVPSLFTTNYGAIK